MLLNLFCKAFVSIIISGILPLFLNVITVNKSSEYYSRSYKIVDSKMEELRNTPFDSLTTGTTNFTVSGLPAPASGSVAITSNIDGAAQTNIKKVTVTVTWTFRGAKQSSAVTYIARGGLK
jgi:hypothetical protein